VRQRDGRRRLGSGAATGRPAERVFALEVVDVGAGARRRLTRPPPGWSDARPRWSPDDAWVSFQRHPVGAPEGGRAWIVPADGGDARPLGEDVTDARWRP
jgi:hypothetical protein